MYSHFSKDAEHEAATGTENALNPYMEPFLM